MTKLHTFSTDKGHVSIETVVNDSDVDGTDLTFKIGKANFGPFQEVTTLDCLGSIQSRSGCSCGCLSSTTKLAILGQPQGCFVQLALAGIESLATFFWLKTYNQSISFL